jgi:hypothetical protein
VRARGRVTCERAVGGTTTARLSYDLTPLSASGEAHLGAFAADFDVFVRHWRDAIAHAVGQT